MDSLPDYMKTVFKFALNVFEECECVGKSEEGLSYNVQGALEEVTSPVQIKIMSTIHFLPFNKNCVYQRFKIIDRRCRRCNIFSYLMINSSRYA